MGAEKVLISFLVLAVTLVILLIVRAVLFNILHRWAERTHTELDNLIISTIKFPSILWCIGISLYIGVETSEIPIKYSTYIVKSIHVLIIFSVTVALANLVSRLLSNYIQNQRIAVQSTGLLHTIIKGAIYLIGIIIILNIFGISIAPLITAMGIGGLAVALALKDTLSNLFAGIHIMAEKTIRVGDFIRLETGQEGYVEDISWRTTRIRMLPNNMVIIPNSMLAQSVVINYHLPEKRMSLPIPVSVSYSEDPEKIERILIEEIKKAVPEIPGLLSEPEPVVRFIPGFGENSLDFTIVCHIEDVSYQFNVQNEIRKRILRRLKEENIEIPLPQRVVWLKKDL
ncbi:MAG: mechanosensitive ion channel family protein [Thermodesulfovibrio sp.]|uniref:mechanosensitive ion channel family protein n=1 Tax=unclassified Thermodesulfovibrio TaxID=2645936 RepID=UPI00083A4E92|nr:MULTISPECIES: mechanosensitive ion channel family protein [unclassified Thermodesulfovibrio]MDI1471883.1 mechanosensitive ion channel family protein [Thermodesulfovibrio sp. 1176]MDI6714954.1 mechanosensitive ion channel family protein [Thermodesulfovibrio sp.]ODA44791.1 Small-conductance mechanosensitive channel [Thermodesulfovibrio sp. N1]